MKLGGSKDLPHAFAEYFVNTYDGFFPAGMPSPRAHEWFAIVRKDLTDGEFEEFLSRVTRMALSPRLISSQRSLEFLVRRLCGPLANSLFHHRPDANFQPDSKLEAAVHKADDSIRKVIQLLDAT